MSIPARYIVAAVLVIFAWKGSVLETIWPPQASRHAVQTPRPPAEVLALASPLKPILPKMLLKDRQYLAAFYDAVTFVLLRDGDRPEPIIGTTDQFQSFHANSLRLAIDRESVGKYPGLAEAIDETIVSIAGAEASRIDEDKRGKLIAACATLAWSFVVGGDG